MALTPAEQKKLEKIQKSMKENQRMMENIKETAAQAFGKLAIKYDLWKLEKKDAEKALADIAKKYNL